MRRIHLKEHQTVAEIEKRYRTAVEGIERSQWQIIWLLANGKGSAAVREATGYSLPWIRTVARRYNAEGADGIGDQRHHNPGRRGALNTRQDQQLKKLVTDGKASGENWNGQRVARWMSEQLGRAVYPQRGYEWLAKWRVTPQVPRPHHTQADEEEQRIFKKSSR